MSNPVCRVMPFSAGPCPMVMPRRKRSLVSSTRRQVMVAARGGVRGRVAVVRCGWGCGVPLCAGATSF